MNNLLLSSSTKRLAIANWSSHHYLFNYTRSSLLSYRPTLVPSSLSSSPSLSYSSLLSISSSPLSSLHQTTIRYFSSKEQNDHYHQRSQDYQDDNQQQQQYYTKGTPTTPSLRVIEEQTQLFESLARFILETKSPIEMPNYQPRAMIENIIELERELLQSKQEADDEVVPDYQQQQQWVERQVRLSLMNGLSPFSTLSVQEMHQQLNNQFQNVNDFVTILEAIKEMPVYYQDPDVMFKVYTWFRDNGCQIMQVFNFFMEYFRRFKPFNFSKVYHDAQKDGKRFDIDTYNTLLAYYTENRSTNQIRSTFQAIANSRLQYTIITHVLEMKNSYYKTNALRTIINNIENDTDIIIDEPINALLLHTSLCFLNDIDKALSYYAKIKAQVEQPSQATYHSLLVGLTAQVRFDLVRKFWNEMISFGVEPDMRTVAAIIRTAADVMDADAAIDFFRYAYRSKPEVSVSSHVLGQLLQVLLFGKKYDQIEELLMHLEKNQLYTLEIYNSVIFAYSYNRDSATCDKIYNSLIKQFEPSIETFEPLINLAVLRNDLEQCTKYYREMCHYKIDPNEHLLNILTRIYFRNGKFKILARLEGFISRNNIISPSTFASLLLYNKYNEGPRLVHLENRLYKLQPNLIHRTLDMCIQESLLIDDYEGALGWLEKRLIKTSVFAPHPFYFFISYHKVRQEIPHADYWYKKILEHQLKPNSSEIDRYEKHFKKLYSPHQLVIDRKYDILYDEEPINLDFGQQDTTPPTPPPIVQTTTLQKRQQEEVVFESTPPPPPSPTTATLQKRQQEEVVFEPTLTASTESPSLPPAPTISISQILENISSLQNKMKVESLIPKKDKKTKPTPLNDERKSNLFKNIAQSFKSDKDNVDDEDDDDIKINFNQMTKPTTTNDEVDGSLANLIMQSPYSFRLRLLTLIKENRFFQAIREFKIKEQGGKGQIDVQSYVTMIKIFVDQKDYTNAASFYIKMLESGYTPGELLTKNLIEVLFNAGREPFQVFIQNIQSNPNIKSLVPRFNDILFSIKLKLKTKVVEDIVKHPDANDLVRSPSIINALAFSLSHRGELELAEKVLQSLLYQKKRISYNSISFFYKCCNEKGIVPSITQELLQYYGKGGEVRTNSNLIPTEIFNSVLLSLYNQGDYAAAYNEFTNRATNYPKELSNFSIRMAVRIYSKKYPLDEYGLGHWLQLRKGNLFRDSKTSRFVFEAELLTILYELGKTDLILTYIDSDFFYRISHLPETRNIIFKSCRNDQQIIDIAIKMKRGGCKFTSEHMEIINKANETVNNQFVKTFNYRRLTQANDAVLPNYIKKIIEDYFINQNTLAQRDPNDIEPNIVFDDLEFGDMDDNNNKIINDSYEKVERRRNAKYFKRQPEEEREKNPIFSF